LCSDDLTAHSNESQTFSMESQNRRWSRADLVVLLGTPNSSGYKTFYPPLSKRQADYAL
jgi:hypothetical protein